MRNKNLIYFAFLIVIFIIFKAWFLPLSLSTGDWGYRFPQTIQHFFIYPYSWNSGFSNGLGGNDIFLLALNTYFSATTSIFFNYLHIPWVIIEKLIWFWPYLAVSILGSFFLFKKVVKGEDHFALFSSLIFTANTYILMVAGGGQVGVAMGYAMTPFVLLSFLNILENLQVKAVTVRESILAGVIFSIQLLFDLRIAYISVFILALYYLIFCLKEGFKPAKKLLVKFAIIPAAVTVLLHFLWLFPFAILRQNPLENLGDAFSGKGMVEYLSFAKFENSISLLHPNWSENIFGKVYFLRPEFLILPVFAFAALLFVNKLTDKQEKRHIIFFALLGLIGAFLAKGTNDPFGQAYVWMFQKIPGFMMFRDPTKWYLLVALSYSLLIPYFLHGVTGFIKEKKYKFISKNAYLVVSLVFVIFWSFTIREAVLGQLKGTFQTRDIPQSYVSLNKLLTSKTNFFRTAWVPVIHQFSPYTSYRQRISLSDFFNTSDISALTKKLSENRTKLMLQNAGVRYVIIPEDTDSRIFLKDRKYSEEEYLKTVNALEKISWLEKTNVFGKIVVFEVSDYKEHFFVGGDGPIGKIQYLNINPTKYTVKITNAKKGEILIFSESYDKGWMLRNVQNNYIQKSQKYELFNSFFLPEGNNSFMVYYAPQGLVDKSFIVSIISFLFVLIYLLFPVLKRFAPGAKKQM
ncbi:MAG: hypothetical protein COX79_02235 [Candidatus Levybacteria bacterium CG_4_10_14_0_2_um_filter_36_16]|nr:MAG: hypothetical protein AUK12_00750 [Candidatus Levybacteria bacterium CG2_30_37_29]PIR78847.1 MAG: hypothetical protein COU26_04465 [Candidatus Levybacteria bacterium CG10_big_fil_rev_8_21_14_0_10_36_30]PIZ97441.1 MAG: hypothetical protein COX79_02235 [Candidatus Levybacteria bacterium CG_4_10_14_0_2_um_filter_36_16]